MLCVDEKDRKKKIGFDAGTDDKQYENVHSKCQNVCTFFFFFGNNNSNMNTFYGVKGDKRIPYIRKYAM